MGLPAESHFELALRDYSEHAAGRRKAEECVPERIIEGNIYEFLKSGQRLYDLIWDVPLVTTVGNADISDPLAVIKILEARHIIEDGKVVTRGNYKVLELCEPGKIYFNGTTRVHHKK